jgi:hypothetical protein
MKLRLAHQRPILELQIDHYLSNAAQFHRSKRIIIPVLVFSLVLFSSGLLSFSLEARFDFKHDLAILGPMLAK